ncbi:hypothetical protein [Nocardioides sp.]|uniref:hypothetical protein n=1 Tax=Nocardioides sp. TaxID=35761 RepID=UPI0025EB093C|nr:hypothetical protein [Nocardioides sp.]
MTTSLHDRLAALADDAPPGGPAPGLWDRGRRVARRRRAGTAVIAAVVVLALGALGALDWSLSRPELAPTDTDALPAEMRLPDHFYEPTHRLPGTEGHPIGPLVAVLGGDRAGQELNGIAGVSAETGEYRYLDLPGYVDGHYLSPDGAQLAYWYGVPATGDQMDDGVDGLAVYDTVTGDVARFPLESEHGVYAEGAAWVGDRIWFGYQRYSTAERRSTTGVEQVVWNPVTQEHREKSGPALPAFNLAYGNNGVLQVAAGRRVELWSADEVSRTRTFRIPRSVDGPAWPSPSGERSVVMADPDGQATAPGEPAAVLVMRTADPTHVDVTPVPGTEVSGVVGWRDERHVVVLDQDGSYSSVDVETGASQPLTTVDEGAYWDPRLEVALDAWSAPTYDAPAPQDPPSPLVVGGIALLVLAAGATAALQWRRRVRA